MMLDFSESSIAVIDDHPIFRKGVVAALGESGGFRELHEGASADDAVLIASQLNPNIILLDMGIPGGGLQALARINQLGLPCRCVVLTACDRAEAAIEALNRGARGYVLKGVGALELLAALATVLEDNTYVSPVFATALLKAAQGGKADEQSAQLTHREGQILAELEKGRTNREIAVRLGITEKTVKFYMSNIMQKFGVSNRVAALMAFRRGRDGAAMAAAGR